jgi:transcriptional regulator with PAS, ATPase and Fis domain
LSYETMMASAAPRLTVSLSQKAGVTTAQLPSVRVRVKAPRTEAIEAELGFTPLVIGTGEDCGVVVRDPAVSRRHCQLTLTTRGVVLEDLGSKNGTLLGGAWLERALLSLDSVVKVGGSSLSLHETGASQRIELSKGATFGDARGSSVVMRALFAQLERAAATLEPIVLVGESGTGKDLLARGVHEHSKRKDGPFVVFDCGAVAPNLVEAELFGWVRGAFTGADRDRAGLLEQAHEGTLFLDEIGELPLSLQPRLLRALETRQVRRLGSNGWAPADARVVAATNRNLRAELKNGAFREDLYYRLAVVELTVPPLRERRDDIPLLVEHFLAQHQPPRTLADLPAHALDLLRGHDWPGNVRELRNMVTRLTLFPDLGTRALPPSSGKRAVTLELPLREGREQAIEDFERAYLVGQLERAKGNVTAAARAMGVSRQFAHRLMARYDIRARDR